MPLTPATRFGTCEIVGPLGTGGMGEVYRAKDVHETLARDADHLARFDREARTPAGPGSQQRGQEPRASFESDKR